MIASGWLSGPLPIILFVSGCKNKRISRNDPPKQPTASNNIVCKRLFCWVSLPKTIRKRRLIKKLPDVCKDRFYSSGCNILFQLFMNQKKKKLIPTLFSTACLSVSSQINDCSNSCFQIEKFLLSSL